MPEGPTIGGVRSVLLLGASLWIAVGCSGPVPRPSAAIAGSWTTVAAAPAALTEVAVAAHDGRIWVAGGMRADGSGSDRVLVLDPTADTWSDGPRLPEGIHHAALVSTGDTLLLLGGYAAGGPTDAVRLLADGTTAWVDTAPLPDPRAAGAAAYDGSRVVYAGGVSPAGVAPEVYALGVEGWERIGRLPRAREHLAATSDGVGRTFVLGGRVGGLGGNLATVDLVAGDAVTTLGDLPTTRGGVGAFWWPALGACLAGGESPGGTNPQVECMDPAGVIAVLPDLGVARHGVGAAVVEGTAYVVLGGRQPGLFTSDITESLALP
jgi:non-specific serine/threonine protein kinase